MRLESSFCRNLRNGQFAASKKVDAGLSLHQTDRAIVYCLFLLREKHYNISRLDMKANLIGSVFISCV